MNIFLPYTFLHPPTLAALAATGRDAVLYEMDSDRAYLEFMAARWRDRVGFIIVEHDVIVTGAQLDSLDACPEEWCGFAAGPDAEVGFCAVRFRASFIERTISVWSDFAALLDGYHDVGEGCYRWDWRRSVVDANWRFSPRVPAWANLDSWLAHREGWRAHRHEPDIVNSRPFGIDARYRLVR